MGERRAYVCNHADHVKGNMAYRIFLKPGEEYDPRIHKCPTHGRLERQPNKPYKKRKKNS